MVNAAEEDDAKKEPAVSAAPGSSASLGSSASPAEKKSAEEKSAEAPMAPVGGGSSASPASAAPGFSDSSASSASPKPDQLAIMECGTDLVGEDVWAPMAAMGAHLAAGRRVSQMSAK